MPWALEPAARAPDSRMAPREGGTDAPAPELAGPNAPARPATAAAYRSRAQPGGASPSRAGRRGVSTFDVGCRLLTADVTARPAAAPSAVAGPELVWAGSGALALTRAHTPALRGAQERAHPRDRIAGGPHAPRALLAAAPPAAGAAPAPGEPRGRHARAHAESHARDRLPAPAPAPVAVATRDEWAGGAHAPAAPRAFTFLSGFSGSLSLKGSSKVFGRDKHSRYRRPPRRLLHSHPAQMAPHPRPLSGVGASGHGQGESTAPEPRSHLRQALPFCVAASARCRLARLAVPPCKRTQAQSRLGYAAARCPPHAGGAARAADVQRHLG